MFGYSRKRNPKTWKDMSVDFRLLFVFHGSMMVLMMTGGGLSLLQEVFIVATLVAILVSISMRHRARTNWHWPGVGDKDVLSAIGAAVAIAFFLFGATPLFPPLSPRILPWYLAGINIGIFGILSALKLVHASEVDFLLHCTTVNQYGQEIPLLSEIPERKIVEADWQKVARGIYLVAFLLVWIAGVASFYFDGASFKSGSAVPTATQTEPLTDHGKTVYITPAEKQRIDRLKMVSWMTMPVVLIGLVIHFIVGVKLFGDAPTLADYIKKKHSGA
jgi:hypothetical protein